MNWNRLIRGIVAFTLIVALAPLSTYAGQAARTMEVTVTNLTKGQVLSPPVVAAHNSQFSLFEMGAPASPELGDLAEDAVSGPLLALLAADPNVGDAVVGNGPIPPGQSLTVQIQITGSSRLITVAGMLVTTNDTFYAVRGARSPLRFYGGTKRRSPGYDAGTEENNELCAFIPGPPCGNAAVRTETAEGFVHIQNGIHGIGDLAPNLFDWRNPVAEITIRSAN